MKQPIIIDRYGYFVGITGDFIVVRSPDRSVEEKSPLSQVSHLVVRGGGITVSSDMLLACARRNITIIILDYRNRPQLVISKKIPGREENLIGRPAGRRFVLKLIKDKIRRQQSVINYHSRSLNRDSNRRLPNANFLPYFNDLKTVDGMGNNLFLIEARASRIYWSLFITLLDPRFGFERRVKRHPADPVNQLLNYGYALLTGRVAEQAVKCGLDLSRVLLHHRQGMAYPLLFDLIEPFRPLADHVVLTFLHRQRRPLQNRRGQLKTLVLRRFRRRFSAVMTQPQPWQKSKADLGRLIIRSFAKAPAEAYLPGALD